MGARKIVDEEEVVRWFTEGRTYEWMTAEYLHKYNLEVAPSIWGNFRRRRGLPRRIVRDDELIPWFVLPEHRWRYPVVMLRTEARSRAGVELSDEDQQRLDSWHDFLKENDVVVYYDRELPDGFVYVPREPGDADVIRQPTVASTQRHNRD